MGSLPFESCGWRFGGYVCRIVEIIGAVSAVGRDLVKRYGFFEDVAGREGVGMD